MGKVFQKRPFGPLVLFLAGGIILSRFAILDLRSALFLLCLAVCGFLIREARLAAGALVITVMGAALYSARYEILSANDVRLIVGDQPALATLRGVLLETPSVRDVPGRTNAARSSYARVRLREILIEKTWRPVEGVLATTTRGEFDPEWFKGRQVEATGVIDLPRAPSAPGLFDFRRYLYHSRIFYQFRGESVNDWRLISFEPLPLTERFQRWAHKQLARGLPFEDEPLEMVRAMALGTHQSFSGEMADAFVRTGTMHIFAISGLHVACIAACVLAILRLAGLPRDRAALILIGLVWFYTLATGWQSSAVRSALMSTFVFAGWAIRRPTELLNSTAGAAFLILMFEPEQLFQASFQLSFTVVTAIGLFLGVEDANSWMIRLQDRILRYDPLLPSELRPAWKQFLEVPVRLVLSNIAISAASWVGSSALTAYYFNVVTPVSLLANLVAVPLSSLSLAATLGSFLIPPLGPFFNYLSWATMWETIVLTRWFSGISWGYFYVPRPDVWFLILYSALVLFCAVRVFRSRALIPYSISFLVVCAAFSALSIGSSLRTTTLTLLPIPGNPVFVDANGRRNDLLLGCSNSRSAEQTVKRFLRAQGVGRLRNLVLTQGNVDSIGGFATIHHEFAPQAVFATLLPGRSRPYRALLAKLESIPGLEKIAPDRTIAGWTVLSPGVATSRRRAEDNAVVLKGEVRGWRILYLGALGSKGQQELIDSPANLTAEILILDVPPRGELIRSDLLERVSPKLVLLGAAEKPFQRNDEKAVRKQLASLGIPGFSTGAREAVSLDIRRTEVLVSHLSRPVLSIRQPLSRASGRRM